MVQLEIDDGSPWWLSMDLWTVPDDPLGAPGLPIVGMPCFIWARVHNRGDTAVSNAVVRYYWANPSVGFNRNTANLVGTANTSLTAGQDADVLCLAPWIPTFVNGGHECILAEAFHPVADPLPPSVDFAVPTDRHVAQRNLSVLMASARSGFFSLAFEVHNTARKTQLAHIALEQLSAAGLRKEAALVGIDVKGKRGKLLSLGFSSRLAPGEDAEAEHGESFEVELAAGERRGLSLIGRLKGNAGAIHIIHSLEGRELGGLSALVLADGATESDQRRSS